MGARGAAPPSSRYLFRGVLSAGAGPVGGHRPVALRRRFGAGGRCSGFRACSGLRAAAAVSPHRAGKGVGSGVPGSPPHSSSQEALRTNRLGAPQQVQIASLHQLESWGAFA